MHDGLLMPELTEPQFVDIDQDAPVVPTNGSAVDRHCSTCACHQANLRQQADLEPQQSRWVPQNFATSFPEPALPCDGSIDILPTTAGDNQITAVHTATSSQHSASKRPARPHICTDCGDRFTRRTSLRRHQQAKHAAVTRVHCPRTDCSYHTKGFTRMDNLLKHLRRKH